MHDVLTIGLEKKRLQELFRYQILETPKESGFDFLVKLAANIFTVPVAAITFIDENRQWIKASIGLNVCETERKTAVCNYTIRQNTINEVQDLSLDQRFRNFPFVAGDPFYRYYAGVPLITEKGYRIGVLCIVDTKARSLDKEEQELLRVFAENAMSQVEINLKNIELAINLEIQKRISDVQSKAVQNQEYNILNTENLEELNGLLKRQAANTFGLLNEMAQWKKLHLLQAIDNIQNEQFKQKVYHIIEETKAE